MKHDTLHWVGRAGKAKISITFCGGRVLIGLWWVDLATMLEVLITTNKKASRERREIIKREYIRLIEHLQNSRNKKAVFNECLQAEVFIIMRESEKKASEYMNFRIKLVLGIKSEGRHVQYSVNKVEVT